MSPTIHAIRHAQGYHNISVENHKIRDPELTPTGIEQCQTLSKEFPHKDSIDLVVASPIKRTIYTALLAFEDLLQKKNMKIIALPELQETSDLPCDTGSSVEEVRKEFDGKPVDLDLVVDGWDSKQGKWAPSAEAVEERCKVARNWLKARPEKNIAVVTHGGFLHYFTEDWHESDKLEGTGWSNTEFRDYTFSSWQPEQAHLNETVESRRRRIGHNKPLDGEELEQLKRTFSQQAAETAQDEAKKETDASHAK